ncbi:MAG: CoA transferase [Chloroflexi bacterium]|nr:CoA transferase [Chloroflexota bacterium]
MTNTSAPLSGVRVADFSVHAAGPFAGMILASLGADVIKVESAARLDITRRPHAMYGKPPSSFEQVNASKRSVTLNLKEARALELAYDLVRISDVVLENFRPGVMDRLGLGYPQLREIKPDIIMVSLSSNGQTGPEARYAGYAPMFAALGGLGYLTGYPDGPPVELRHAMDHTGGMMAAFSAVAALCAHRNHQVGQRADVAVRDIATAFMGHALMDTAMNDRDAARLGNRDDAMAPHGVFPCVGEDQWVTIVVADDAEWRALKVAMGNPEWADADEYGDAFLRWRNQDTLECRLSEWTATRRAEEVTAVLQSAGVAAFPSLSADQLMVDPHLAERDAFPATVHAEKGEQRAVAPPWRFSETSTDPLRWTPDLGEHNREVFCGLLGMEESELARLQETHIVW